MSAVKSGYFWVGSPAIKLDGGYKAFLGCRRPRANTKFCVLYDCTGREAAPLDPEGLAAYRLRNPENTAERLLDMGYGLYSGTGRAHETEILLLDTFSGVSGIGDWSLLDPECGFRTKSLMHFDGKDLTNLQCPHSIPAIMASDTDEAMGTAIMSGNVRIEDGRLVSIEDKLSTITFHYAPSGQLEYLKISVGEKWSNTRRFVTRMVCEYTHRELVGYHLRIEYNSDPSSSLLTYMDAKTYELSGDWADASLFKNISIFLRDYWTYSKTRLDPESRGYEEIFRAFVVQM